jgi:hypothetical protein
MSFASTTSVSVEKSRAELSSILSRYGATGFQYGWSDREDHRLEQVTFSTKDRIVRFILHLPLPSDKQFRATPAGKSVRNDQQRTKAWEQACRSRWRALLLCVKAKLEAVSIGISQFEDEFLAYVVDPVSDKTMGDIIRPQIADRYNGGTGLLGLPAPERK